MLVYSNKSEVEPRPNQTGQRKADSPSGTPVIDEDVETLSPFVRADFFH